MDTPFSPGMAGTLREDPFQPTSQGSNAAGSGSGVGGNQREAIQTIVRIRPDIDGHQQQQATKVVFAQDRRQVCIGKDGRGGDVKTFTFDGVFGEDTTQQDMFAVATRFVDASMKGYNGTIFASDNAFTRAHRSVDES